MQLRPFRHTLTALILSGAALLTQSPAEAEGTAQWGLNQPLLEFGNITLNTAQTRISSASRALYVDVVSAGEVINVSVCGEDSSSTINLRIFETIDNPVDPTFTPTTGTQLDNQSFTSNISCTDPLSGPITGGRQFIAPAPGRYEIRLTTTGGSRLRRVDITVTPNTTSTVDPTAAGGRLHAYVHAFNAGSFAESASTDANYYVKVPGGKPGENYVWQLDLNNFAGFVYDIVGNAYGVEAPNSGFSVPTSGNDVTPEYPVYASYPAQTGPLPTVPPSVNNFQFRDNAGQDNTISPNGTVGVQDSGVFSFSTDVIGTYSIQIDINQDGIYSPEDINGDPSGDVFINGITNGPSTVTAPWDGRSNTGDTLLTGIYNAKLEMRIGEYHFIATDAETSGGPSQRGLTIFQALSQTVLQDTYVFWDDQTFLNGTTTLPNGELSSSPGGDHQWGNFTSGGFGNLRYIDTYVFGDATTATTAAVIADNEDPVVTNPNVALTKRITAINRDRPDAQLFDTTFQDAGTASDDDNEVNWPGGSVPATIGGGTVESYINGVADATIAGVMVDPGDEIEYTLSFLSNGPVIAQDSLVCDRIPDNTSFMPTAFDSSPAASAGPGPRGILLEFNGNTLALTNAHDGDEIANSGTNDNGAGGYYFPPNLEPSTLFPGINCGGTNINGAIVVDLSDLPNSIGEGSPTGSFGFIRFRVVVD